MTLGGSAQWGALAMTLAIEVPIVVAAMRWRAPNTRWSRSALTGIAATCLTHPVVWFLMLRVLRGAPFLTRLAIAEVFAIVVEAMVYWRFLRISPRQAIILSTVANAASAGIGLLLKLA